MKAKKDSRFSRWLYGEKDPLLGKVEMKPQVEKQETKQISDQEFEAKQAQLLEIGRAHV